MIDPIDRYILEHIDVENSTLWELDRQTHLRVLQPRMLSGHLQGDLLRILTRMIRPQRVLELGTFTGYSAISMALGMEAGAVLHTIELHDELYDIAREFIQRAGVEDRVVQHIGDCMSIIPTIGEVFDLIFIDADKRQYPQYYDVLMDQGYVRSGTVMLADNVLWSGKVVQNPLPTDSYTRGVMEFNRKVAQDDRVEKVILPLRDGLSVIRVK